MPFDGRISGFGSVSGVRCVLSSHPVGFDTLGPGCDTLGGDCLGFGSRRPPFDTQCAFSTLLLSGFSALSVSLDTLGTPSDPPADGFDPLRPPNRVSTLSFARDTLSDPTPVSALHFCGLFYVSNPFLHFRVFLSISQ